MRRRFMLLLAALAAACDDGAGPGLTASLSRGGHYVLAYEDSASVVADSVAVVVSGPGAEALTWSVGSSPSTTSLALAATGDTGTGIARWSRSLAPLVQAVHVDTLTITFGGGVLAPLTLVDTFEVRWTVPEYVTRRRAWLPGERDSLIARIIQNRSWTLPYIGDISDQAPLMLDPDSAIELVRNPALPAPPAWLPGPFGALRVPGSGWTTAGIDTRIIDNSQAPADTTDYLGFFWSNNADDTWKGFVFAAAPGTTVGATNVNTTPYDAGGHNNGAGGGEFRLAAPTTYWEARGWVRRNTVRVTGNTAFGGATTVTTGPFLGGTQQVAFFSGQLDSVRMDRITGTFGSNPQYASASFSFIGGIRLTCVFPTPCTTNVLRAAAAARAGRMTPALRAELPWVPGRRSHR